MRKKTSLLALLIATLLTLVGCFSLPAVSGPDSPGGTRAAASTTGATTSTTPTQSDQRTWKTPGEIDSVVAISIDGLSIEAIKKLGPTQAPRLHKFMKAGASTLNARTEFEMTVTLPNHTGMVTGRRIEAATGGHGVTWNDDRKTPATVQAAAGRDVLSVFTSVHDAGGSTAMFASKTKFSLFQRSWPSALDRATIIESNPRLVAAFRSDLSTDRAFRFLHLSLPDVAGHAYGWMSPQYLQAVRQVDRLLGRTVRAINADPDRRAHTAIVLTSDHGGKGANHVAAAVPANYRVMFMVQGPGIDKGADLYKINPDYTNPRSGRPTYDNSARPIRNGMVANLSLDLLGLAPVPGSEFDFEQDLEVTATP